MSCREKETNLAALGGVGEDPILAEDEPMADDRSLLGARLGVDLVTKFQPTSTSFSHVEIRSNVRRVDFGLLFFFPPKSDKWNESGRPYVKFAAW
jgi:hypothetical protein